MRGSRRTRLTLVLLLLTAFTLTALDYNSAQSGPLAALRRGIDTVFGPVQRAVGSAANSVGSALGGLPRLGSYQSENKKLRRENTITTSSSSTPPIGTSNAGRRRWRRYGTAVLCARI